MSIQTPDQRLRVFVSSTLEELADDRRRVRDAIERLRLTPVMFEQGARPHPPRALYRAYLQQSDVFVGVYWQRYGWVAPGEETSGLEDEYSLSGTRPKLIYLKVPAPDREQRLSDLIERIQRDDGVSYRPFGDAEELGSLVADDLAVLLTERFSATDAEAAVRSAPISLPPLPRPPTALIGRDRDVARVLDLLTDPATRLVTVVGPGGIGKSRAALRVAERAAEALVDRVAYVELAPVTEPSVLLPAMANALGLQERAGVSVARQLRDLLAEAPTLLVLDNMEQLADAAGDLADLLAGVDALKVLVTSRRVLNIRGERIYSLDPLALPTDDSAVTSAVELFLDRARAVRPDYEPNETDRAAIAELTRRLDGLPLAIELAGARLRLLSPGAVLERMGHHRLTFLQSGARDLPPRQRTLRDTLSWSRSMLSARAQVLFARLAVIVGSADLDAIEQVANPEGALDILELLADLVDASLVRVAGEVAEPRFGMLETIREYATELLDDSGEKERFIDRHSTYFVELAERGDVALGTAGQVEWLTRLHRETDNFRAVFRRSVRRDDARTALRLGRALATYWQMCGAYAEGLSWMQQVAALPGADPVERADAWVIGAIQAFLQGDWAVLETGLDDALPLVDAEGRRWVSFALLLRAVARGGSLDDARWQEELAEAVRRLEADGEPLAVGFGLVAGARLARVHGRPDEARRLGQEAHELSREIGEWYLRMNASLQLGLASLELGDPRNARHHAAESLDAARRMTNLSAACDALGTWAMADLRDGRAEHAGWVFALAERGYRQAGAGDWRPDAEFHGRLSAELQAALGDQYQRLISEVGDIDLDEAITELARSG